MMNEPRSPGILVTARWPETLLLWRKVFGTIGVGGGDAYSYRIVGHWDRGTLGVLLGYRADDDKTMDVVLYKGEELWCDTDCLMEVSDG